MKEPSLCWKSLTGNNLYLSIKHGIVPSLLSFRKSVIILYLSPDIVFHIREHPLNDFLLKVDP